MTDHPLTAPRRAGRPTRAAAALRDERLLAIAADLFMAQGFESTTMEGLAEAAGVGKATLYARWADKTALFADVLRRRILEIYEPLEEEFNATAGGTLPETLRRVADRLLERALEPGAVALGRILSVQGSRFPDLAELAITEGFGRQQRLVAAILARHAADPAWAVGDPDQSAELFLALVLGRAARLKIYGIAVTPADLAGRTAAAVALFVRGLRA